MGQAATCDNVPQWRMTETNSYFGGGKAGVSDTEAAALWSLDYLDGVAAHGGAGVNFHGGGAAAYTPIVYSGVAQTVCRACTTANCCGCSPAPGRCTPRPLPAVRPSPRGASATTYSSTTRARPRSAPSSRSPRPRAPHASTY